MTWREAQRSLTRRAETIRVWFHRKAGMRIKMSDRIYTVASDGSLRRESPMRPWRGKSERRELLKIRRVARRGA